MIFISLRFGCVTSNPAYLLCDAPCLRRCAAPQITPPVSVQKQLEYLATVTQKKDNGRFVGNIGEDLPW